MHRNGKKEGGYGIKDASIADVRHRDCSNYIGGVYRYRFGLNDKLQETLKALLVNVQQRDRKPNTKQLQLTSMSCLSN